MSLPLVGVSARSLSDQKEYWVDESYLRALVEGSKVLSLLISVLPARRA